MGQDADPFLPLKIEDGRPEDIRECIGCDVCVSGDMTHGLSRCTQNTAFMEEWRRGWHPERPRPKGPSSSILVVGTRPAGLESALQFGRRGYRMLLAEAADTLGGRVQAARCLPKLAAWSRLADWPLGQIAPMPNVEVYPASRLSAEDVLAMGCELHLVTPAVKVAEWSVNTLEQAAPGGGSSPWVSRSTRPARPCGSRATPSSSPAPERAARSGSRPTQP